jgi:hypothetical protein
MCQGAKSSNPQASEKHQYPGSKMLRNWQVTMLRAGPTRTGQRLALPGLHCTVSRIRPLFTQGGQIFELSFVFLSVGVLVHFSRKGKEPLNNLPLFWIIWTLLQ